MYSPDVILSIKRYIIFLYDKTLFLDGHLSDRVVFPERDVRRKYREVLKC